MPLAPAALPRRSVPPAAAVLRSGARLGALRPPSWGLGVTHGRHVPHRLNFASQVRGVLAGHPQGRLCDRVVLQRGGRRPAPYAGELVSGLRLPVGWPRQAGPRDGSNGKCRAAAPLRRAGSTRPPGSSQRRGGGSLHFPLLLLAVRARLAGLPRAALRQRRPDSPSARPTPRLQARRLRAGEQAAQEQVPSPRQLRERGHSQARVA